MMTNRFLCDLLPNRRNIIAEGGQTMSQVLRSIEKEISEAEERWAMEDDSSASLLKPVARPPNQQVSRNG